jgi:3-oxoadipate enol-lactonase
MGEHVRAGDLDIWTEQVGQGPDVLLIGGGGDTVESWQFQLDGLADRYRLTPSTTGARAGRRCLGARSRWR